MKSFIRQILDSFVVGSDAARLSVFRFNAVIDSRTQILLKDFPDDKEGFLRAYDRIPYDGQGTRTGAALTHALNVMLAPGNGNRPGIPDSVFVITDGVSQDHVTSAANKLRLAGVEVYAVGVVPPRGNLNRRQLFDIAGRAENLVIAEQGFDGLDQSLFDDIQRQICTEGCFEELV
uniref:VWFA domain-containing protein n=1 Tax=Ciona savignyi TaxID=51511 RepID=H2YPF8_CIOSA